MSRPFSGVERFLERLLERPAARLFRTRLQPVQIQRRLERAMESRRVSNADRTYVPNRYRVLLHPSDLETFESYRDTLEHDLAEALLRRARSRGYRLVARPQVLLVASPTVAEGDVEVASDVLDPGLVRSAAAGLRAVDLEGPRPPRHPIPGTAPVPVIAGAGGVAAPGRPAVDGPAPGVVEVADNPGMVDHVSEAAGMTHAETPDGGEAQVERGAAGQPPLNAGGEAVDEATSAMPHPETHPPPPVIPAGMASVTTELSALIEVRPAGMRRWSFVFRGGAVRIGRGMDNEIVLADDRVSRSHAQLTSRQGTLVFTDLSSSNGSFVNGSRVREIVLGDGDVVRMGNSTLTIRRQP